MLTNKRLFLFLLRCVSHTASVPYYHAWPACILLFCCLLQGCDLVRVKDHKDRDSARVQLARVYDTYLYADEVIAVLPPGAPAKDSIARLKDYVKKWVQQQLLIAEARQHVDHKAVDIEQKINDYRNLLIERQFQQQYIERHPVDSVSSEDIESYYNTHQDRFILQRAIVKATYVKTHQETASRGDLKTLIFADDPSLQEELKSYCISYAAAYYLSNLNWIEFDKLIADSPLAFIPDKVVFLKQHVYYEAEDANFLYILKVNAYKLPGAIAPLEFVASDIENTIISRRKKELIQRHKKEIYKKAFRNKDFEIYME